jgi:hypothetical protein
MLLLMKAKNERQLLELYCRERYPISILASKNLILLCLHPICLSFFYLEFLLG